jgi:rhodanese-related sulfurtransferase
MSNPHPHHSADVASPEELRAFVEKAGDKLVVIDTRNPDAAAEPHDQASFVNAPLPTVGVRPRAKHLQWDRSNNIMPIPDGIAKDTPIITHCGGGMRGQLAKEYLEQQGFTQVINGGGPRVAESWAEFGDK